MNTDIFTLKRQFSPLDTLITELGHALHASFASQQADSTRPSPASSHPETPLNEAECKQSAGLMRVNHSGEIAAQALYRGQALTAREKSQQKHLQTAAEEEIDHLAWCETRLHELGSHTSRLAPLWYLGSFTIGTLAGIAGDQWSLGFVEETENQVTAHLDSHLQKLPENDLKSRAVVEKMREDEMRHAETAKAAGAAELPDPVKALMTQVAKVMTKTSYWI